MFNGSINSVTNGKLEESLGKGFNTASTPSDSLLTIDEVQKTLNRSRASVYRYTNTDTRNLNLYEISTLSDGRKNMDINCAGIMLFF